MNFNETNPKFWMKVKKKINDSICNNNLFFDRLKNEQQ